MRVFASVTFLDQLIQVIRDAIDLPGRFLDDFGGVIGGFSRLVGSLERPVSCILGARRRCLRPCGGGFSLFRRLLIA